MIRVGTAGWRLPAEWKDRFPDGDSHLERYARVLSAAEINRTFRKQPMDRTFERWARTVPEGFRFSVKAPREVTHSRRLEDAAEPLEDFLDGVGQLGDRLGPILVQLPPSLEYDALLSEHRVARVAADPPRADADGRPGGHEGLAYFRLHGSPETYRSAYRDDGLDAWEAAVRDVADDIYEVWCVFDNTAEGEGTGDALELRERLKAQDSSQTTR